MITTWPDTQTLAGGVHFYRGDSPRTDRRGALDAEDGVITSASQRDVYYGARFSPRTGSSGGDGPSRRACGWRPWRRRSRSPGPPRRARW